jgi:hypothetical protein
MLQVLSNSNCMEVQEKLNLLATNLQARNHLGGINLQ